MKEEITEWWGIAHSHTLNCSFGYWNQYFEFLTTTTSLSDKARLEFLRNNPRNAGHISHLIPVKFIEKWLHCFWLKFESSRKSQDEKNIEKYNTSGNNTDNWTKNETQQLQEGLFTLSPIILSTIYGIYCYAEKLYIDCQQFIAMKLNLVNSDILLQLFLMWNCANTKLSSPGHVRVFMHFHKISLN